MKKPLGYAMLVVLLLLYGCGQSENDDQNGQAQNNDDHSGDEQMEDNENNNEDEENNMADIDIFEFKHIAQAPETTEAKAVQEVIKVYFAEHSIDIPLEDEAVAIDIANNEIYVHPVINHRGFRATGGVVELNEAEKVIDILETYHVQEWPDSEGEDGYFWMLRLQYEDGSVQRYEGNEATEKPEQFEAFNSALREFVAERMEED